MVEIEKESEALERLDEGRNAPFYANRRATIAIQCSAGPWRIVQYSNYVGFSIESTSSPDFGCIAERWESIHENGRKEERLANARLIAAAPSLLAACEAAHSLLDFNEIIERADEDMAEYKSVVLVLESVQATLKCLEAAIAKARGQS